MFFYVSRYASTGCRLKWIWTTMTNYWLTIEGLGLLILSPCVTRGETHLSSPTFLSFSRPLSFLPSIFILFLSYFQLRLTMDGSASKRCLVRHHVMISSLVFPILSFSPLTLFLTFQVIHPIDSSSPCVTLGPRGPSSDSSYFSSSFPFPWDPASLHLLILLIILPSPHSLTSFSPSFSPAPSPFTPPKLISPLPGLDISPPLPHTLWLLLIPLL